MRKLNLRNTSRLWIMLIIASVFAGCSSVSNTTPTPEPDANAESAPDTAGENVGSGTNDPAAAAVERYLLAKVAGDGERLRDVLCSEMESLFEREVLSFSGVEASVDGMVCRRDEGGDSTHVTVTCEGSINAVYGTESRSFPLTTYRAVEEDGAWRWCGEAAAPAGS